ncbi:MAG: hypothetical protein ACFFB3_17285, partial [Candidatus Hodarchaeota archaeon]
MSFSEFSVFSALIFMLLIPMMPIHHASHSFPNPSLEKKQTSAFRESKSQNSFAKSSLTFPATTDMIPYNSNHNGSSDGSLGAGEYQSVLEISLEPNITLYWEQNGTFLFWAAYCDIDGYFSIGWPIKDKIDPK